MREWGPGVIDAASWGERWGEGLSMGGHDKESGYSLGGFRRRCGVAGVASDHE
jgi:hypothetical protein